jgi:hypothetical protein
MNHHYLINAILLTLSVFICGVVNMYLASWGTGISFFVLPVLWALALLLPVHTRLKDKMYAYIMFTIASWILWFLMLVLGASVAGILLGMHDLFGFPVLGGLGALFSYLLYSKLVLQHFTAKSAIICFLLGYGSLVISEHAHPSEGFFSGEEGYMFFYWQSLQALAMYMLLWIGR